jgi:hypothetical protein
MDRHCSNYIISRTMQALLITLMISVFSTFSNADERQEFDEICRIYTEINNSNMSKDVASKYVMANVKERAFSKDVLIAHEAIMQAMPDQYYKLFKQSAEWKIGSVWHCDAIEHLPGSRW